MRELLFLGKELAKFSGKLAAVVGVIGIGWVLLIGQAPSLPLFS